MKQSLILVEICYELLDDIVVYIVIVLFEYGIDVGLVEQVGYVVVDYLVNQWCGVMLYIFFDYCYQVIKCDFQIFFEFNG